jgi:hypothetical protein
VRTGQPAFVDTAYPCHVDVGHRDNTESAESDEALASVTSSAELRGSPAQWLRTTNYSPGVIAFVRRARRLLPGDPEFGDPLSTAGDGGPRAAARAADRLLGDRDAASREVSLSVLQVWQALTEAVSRRPANPEVTLVFTDLVEFSTWSLQAGDDATLALLRQVARAVEPPLLDSGGHIVKRLGDGLMAVFRSPAAAVHAVLAARDAVRSLEVDVLPAAHAGRYPHRTAAAAGRRLARCRREHRRPRYGTRHKRRDHGVRRDPGSDTAKRTGRTRRRRQTCT